MDVEGLSIVCAGLGSADEDETGAVVGYTKGQYCLDNLKDLQRFMRRDDPQTREVFHQVCRWNAAALHLVPMVMFCQGEQKLVMNAVKVLVFLTMPIDPSSDDVSQQIEHLWSLKAAVARSEAIAVIMSLLEDPLENLESGAFTEDDWKLIQLVLTLFRNVLAIQEITSEQKASGFASQLVCLRDKFLGVMFEENVMDLILVLAQHAAEEGSYLHQDIFLILEILHYILVNHDPELIALSSQKDDEEIGKMSLKSLESLIEEEEEKKRLSRLRSFDFSSQFQGTFTCLAMDGSKLMLKGTPTASCGKSLLKAHKTPKGSIRKVAWNHENISLPNQKILKLLHDFVNQFISGGYSVLMQSIHDEIERDHHAIETSDVNIFFKLAHFITAFQHHKYSVLKDCSSTSELHNSSENRNDTTLFHGDICGPLSATMNEAMFLLVISQWRDAFEGLKQTNDYQSLSAAGSIMKDMIRMLALVLRLSPDDSTEPQTVRILLYKLFYDQTDQGFTQFLVTLIRSFDCNKQPKSDLADLVEILATVLQLMEHLQARGTLRVAKKSRKRKSKKHLSDAGGTGTESLKAPQADTQLVGDECHKSLVNSGETTNKSNSEGLEKPRADRNEGTVPCNVAEGAQLAVDDAKDTCLNEQEKNNHTAADFIDLADEDSGSSGDDYPTQRNEVDFDLIRFLSYFANSSCIQNVCWLLKFYRSNSHSTNDHIVFFLRQISVKLELSPIFYQLSVLIIFYDIIEEQEFSAQKEHAEIVLFLTKLIRKLLKIMKNQPLLFVEMLFWKTQRECRSLTADTLTHKVSKLKKQVRNLCHVSDGDEDIYLPKEKEFAGGRSIADALGDDEAEIPFSYDFANQTDEVLENNASQKAYGRKRKLEFTSEEEDLIRELYEKYKHYRNCSRLIAEALDINGNVSAVQVSAKLKKLGLSLERKGRKSFEKGPNSDKAQADVPDARSENMKHGCVETETRSSGKRICVFSKEQEVKIREFFEKYKDHKRCSFMIAKELHADNVYSTSQISRKLKQLGLQVPRRKKISEPKDLEQNEVEDMKTSETHFPEKNQPRRRKNMLKTDMISESNSKRRPLAEEFSDEDVLSSILLKSKKASRLSTEKTAITDSAETRKQLRLQDEEMPDDETLGSLFQKREEVTDKHPARMIDPSNELMESAAPNSTFDNSMDPQLFNQNPPGASDRMEVEQFEEEERLQEVNDDNDDNIDEVLADDLADSGDEGVYVIPKSFEGRRKIRIIDSDDE